MQPSINDIDPAVVKVVKTIKQLEGGNYEDRTGDSGSSAGAFQWNNNKVKLGSNEVPARWKEHAKEILGDENVPMSKENQNKVIYGKVKKWKDAGLQPEEIDALWNGAKKDSVTGKYTHISEDRANKFRQTIRGGGNQPTFNPKPFSSPEAGKEIVQPEEVKTEPNKQGGLLNNLENFGAGVGSELGSAGLGLISGTAKLFGADKFADKIQKRKEIAFEKPILPENQSLETKSAKAGKIAGEIAPYLAGGGGILANIAKDIVIRFGQTDGDVKQAGIAGVLSGGFGLAGKAFKGLTKVIDDVAPELTTKTFKGATTKGLLGKIKPVIDENTRKIAEVVEQSVPNFKNMNTYTEKLNATKKALGAEAEALKEAVRARGQKIIYPFKELASKMKNVDRGIEIKSDPVINRKFDLTMKTALKVAKDKGGTIDGLFDARKAFDDIVEREFPTLYDRPNAPFRSAVTKIRNVMNDAIEQALPKEAGYRQSLFKQRKLFEAIDNLSPKSFGEVGGNAVSRFAEKNPKTAGLLKTAGKVAGTGLATVLGLKGYDRLTK